MVVKIVSGGQTGIDRVGLNAAIALGLEYGGWAPKNYLSEDGKVPTCYNLKEYPIAGYQYRTEQNVLDSDGTLIFTWDYLFGGTRLTRNLCKRHKQPYLVIFLKKGKNHVERIKSWVEDNQTKVLNVAGPRQGVCKGYSLLSKGSIPHQAYKILMEVLK